MRTDDLIFYQIYPKSFCDSDGDGLGDIQGIRERIGYLKELGITAVWITPCFESPEVDNGYDIADYRKIKDEMGGTELFKKLLDEFHENGIKVIVDLVANHTSTEHVWFQESKKSNESPYRDYYIRRETPPNNWESTFGGSAWEYDENTKEYYLHSFAVEQADVNWENPKVRQEFRDIVDYWMAMGADGFRCDVLDLISKDLTSEENGSGPRLHEFIKELFDREPTKDAFTVGECWSSDQNNVKLFCGKERKELTTVFAMQHLCLDNGRFCTKKPTLKELCKRMADWQDLTQGVDVCNTSFLENHDQPRSVSKFGNDREYRYESATLLGGLVLLQRGVPFLFQGQEIGMTNAEYTTFEQFNDVESVNYYQMNEGKIPAEERIACMNFGGRDNPRCLIPWTDKDRKSWITEYPRKSEVNVAKDLQSEKSVFKFYQKLIALRKAEKAIASGTFKKLALTDEYYVFERVYGEEKITVICAFERGAENVINAYDGKIVLNNYDKVGDRLLPYQIVVKKA